jgi:hypothetical protein
MAKPSQNNIVDEIFFQMPLEEKVSLANMKKEDVRVLQGVFDLYIRSKVDTEDEDYENIMHELWKRVRETHRLRVVK